MSEFYTSGLKFSCKRCSTCCRYDSGFVFLSEKDLEELTEQLKISRDSFIRKYCRWVTDFGGKVVLSLKEKINKDCVLWDNGCLVYISRPLQCKTFPFWESILSSEKTWEIAASGCPGINNGEYHSGKAIGEYVKMRTSQPIISKSGGVS